MPQNHAQTLRERKPLSRRAKGVWAAIGVVVIAAVLVLVLATGSPAARPGCIATTLPGVIGAQTYDECGAAARNTCAGVRESRSQFGSVGVIILEKACRKGGIPVG